ncbi:MAG: hypothetical protein VCE75_03205 [Alphaproteobacteria bacterium]
MAGRGKVEAQDKKSHPRVLMLTKGNLWAPSHPCRIEIHRNGRPQRL